MATDVLVPTLGESITEATLGQWLKKPGEPVKVDEPIASLETDKVAVEVPAPVAGTMGDPVVSEGDTVAVGAVIARIETNGGATAPKQEVPEFAATPSNPAGPGETPAEKTDPTAPHSDEAGGLTLSPAVRRVVLEHHLDPSKIKGTGKDGRLTKDDVLAAAKAGKSVAGTADGPPVAKSSAPAPSAPAKAGAQPEARDWVPASAGTQERREERVRM